jgi:hypothetical protein
MGYLGRTPTPSPVTADDIPANSIDASKIVDGSIELAEIADNSITDAKLNSSKLDGIATSANNYTHPATHATADIADNAITEAKIADAAVVSLKSGRKNLIINGGFDVWQRGTSFSPTGSRMYTADRWSFEGASLTISRSTDVPSGHLFKYSARIQNTSGATSNNRSYIEDLNTLLPNGIPWTLSAWVKVTSGGINLDLGDTDVVSGGFSTSSVWTKISVSSSSRNTAGVNAFLDIFVDANTDAYITGIQLELGSVATDFEHRSFGEELALCKRYYQKSFVYSTTPANGANSSGFSTQAGLVYSQASHNSSNRDYYHFEVEMRTTPSLTMYGNSSGYWHSPTSNWHVHNKVTNEVSSKGFGFRQQASGGVIPVRGHYAASAEL